MPTKAEKKAAKAAKAEAARLEAEQLKSKHKGAMAGVHGEMKKMHDKKHEAKTSEENKDKLAKGMEGVKIDLGKLKF